MAGYLPGRIAGEHRGDPAGLPRRHRGHRHRDRRLRRPRRAHPAGNTNQARTHDAVGPRPHDRGAAATREIWTSCENSSTERPAGSRHRHRHGRAIRRPLRNPVPSSRIAMRPSFCAFWRPRKLGRLAIPRSCVDDVTKAEDVHGCKPAGQRAPDRTCAAHVGARTARAEHPVAPSDRKLAQLPANSHLAAARTARAEHPVASGGRKLPQLPANPHLSAARTARAEHPVAPGDPNFRSRDHARPLTPGNQSSVRAARADPDGYLQPTRPVRHERGLPSESST